MADLHCLSNSRGALNANVIFVHGLGGDSRGTWTSPLPPPSEERLWPKWLASDVEGLAVWSVGYDAPVSEWRGLAMDLADRAGNVLSLLETEDRTRQRRIDFHRAQPRRPRYQAASAQGVGRGFAARRGAQHHRAHAESRVPSNAPSRRRFGGMGRLVSCHLTTLSGNARIGAQ